MAKFKIGLTGNIARIPGHLGMFHSGEEYETDNEDEILELRLRPDYVAAEITAVGDPPVPEVVQPPKELERVMDKKAVRDELLTTPVPELKKRTFADGTSYDDLKVNNKRSFVKRIMDKLEADRELVG